MKVKELIEKLEHFDQEKVVTIWDAYNDQSTEKIFVSEISKTVHIGNHKF